MNGFDALVELNREGVRRLVRAYWASSEASDEFKKIENPIDQLHRIWPLPLQENEAVEAGLTLAVHLQPTRLSFPKGNSLGLDKDESVDIALYASSPSEATARLWTAFRFAGEIEVRYPGELTSFRKCGDFVKTDVSAIVVADGTIARETIEDGHKPNGDVDCAEALVLGIEGLQLREVLFYDSTPLPPEIDSFLRRLIGELLPLMVGSRSIPISPKLNKLFGDIGVTRGVDHPLHRFRSFNPSGTDVTGALSGDARFASGVDTDVLVGASFGYPGHPLRGGGTQADLLNRAILLRGRKSHVAFSFSSWTLQYFKDVHVESVVRSAWNDAIIAKHNEPKQEPDKPLRHRLDRGWALFDPDHGMTDDEDDNNIVLINLADAFISGGDLINVANIEIIQKVFGIDAAAPDTDMEVTAVVSMHVTDPGNPNFEEFKKLIPKVESFDAKRTDGWLKVLASLPATVLDFAFTLVVGLGDAIHSILTLDVNFDATKRAAINFGIDFATLFTPVIVFVINVFMPDKVANLIPAIGVPSLKFFSTPDALKLTFRDEPIRDPGVGNLPHDEGLTIFALVNEKPPK